MKKFRNLKLLSIGVAAIFLITGCTNTSLKTTYNKMQVSSNMNGYEVDLRVYGVLNDESVRDYARINNYNNSEYRISTTVTTKALNSDNLIKDLVPTEEHEKNVTYVYKDNTLYVQDEEKGIYTKSNDSIPYTNTDVFLKALIKSTTVKKLDNETIGDNEYTVYEMKTMKNTVNEMMKYTKEKDYKATKDVHTKVWVDKDGYLYKIVYDLNDKLTLNAVFFSYNNSRTNNINVEEQKPEATAKAE